MEEADGILYMWYTKDLHRPWNGGSEEKFVPDITSDGVLPSQASRPAASQCPALILEPEVHGLLAVDHGVFLQDLEVHVPVVFF